MAMPAENITIGTEVYTGNGDKLGVAVDHLGGGMQAMKD
jgi:hypothetical protein